MWEPQPDHDAAGALGETLRGLGYDEEAIEERLGEDGIAAEGGDALVHALRLDDDELGDAIRLLLLARPVARSSFAAAPELVRLGLATEDGALLVPRARIVPTEGVYLAFDTFSDGDDDPPGWVASFTPTAYWLASLTLRRRVARALDIGTGNGVHALLAAAARRRSRRDRHQPARARVHADQRRAERHRQRRDAARQPVRAGRRRDVRAHHVQRAVRHLTAGTLAVPRRGFPGRRVLTARRHERGGAPRGRRLCIGARELARGV